MNLVLETVAEKHNQLANYTPPVLDGHRPFFTDFLDRQVDRLAGGVVRWVKGLRLGELAEHPVEALHRVGRIDQRPNLLGILEVGGQLDPVRIPGFASI